MMFFFSLFVSSGKTGAKIFSRFMKPLGVFERYCGKCLKTIKVSQLIKRKQELTK